MSFGKRTPQSSNNRRASARTSAAASAHILLSTGKTVSCRLLDLSDTGAKLGVDSVLGLPAQFDLKVRGQIHRAQVTRRSPRVLAIKFN